MAKTAPLFAPYSLSNTVTKTKDPADGFRSTHQQKRNTTAGSLGVMLENPIILIYSTINE